MLSFTMLKRTLHARHNSLLVMHLLDDIWLNFLCRSSVFKDSFLYFANPWIFLRNCMTSYGNNTNKTSVVTYRHFWDTFALQECTISAGGVPTWLSNLQKTPGLDAEDETRCSATHGSDCTTPSQSCASVHTRVHLQREPLPYLKCLNVVKSK